MLLKLNKKLILLCSSEAPLWDRYLQPVTKGEISRILNISATTVSNWQGGAGVDGRKLIEMFVDAKAELKTRVDGSKEKKQIEQLWGEIYESLTNDRVSVYDFGERLGYSITTSQRVIDQAIYKIMPVFRDIYYENSSRDTKRARDDFRIFGGVYRAYIDRGADTIQAVLRVRYILELDGNAAIRAKLNIPRYVNKHGEQRDYHEYDGFLSVKSHNVFWMFEERDSALSDFFYMITERSDISTGLTVMKGEYLSAERSRESGILSGRVFLSRENIDKSEHRTFMHKKTRMLSGSSYDDVLAKVLSSTKD